MKKKIIFRGVGTALITPMRGGEIDYSALGSLIDMQISSGVDALIIGGTTGEVATLDDEERYALYRFAAERTNGRTKLIFGVGTNDTKKAISHAKVARGIGCDGILAVTPYYNKGTADGIVSHYLALADATELPMIVYNVPSRTGVDLSISQLSRFLDCERIVAIKEACDSAKKLAELSLFGDELGVYSGSDTEIYTNLALGGLGVISVVSNILPREISELCRKYFSGDTGAALAAQKRYLPFICALFTETNPAPIKYAMSRLGLSENELRLPMSTVRESTERTLDTEWARLHP